MDVPFVTTPPAVTEAMLNIAKVGPKDFVLDLGSGDGRIVILAVVGVVHPYCFLPPPKIRATVEPPLLQRMRVADWDLPPEPDRVDCRWVGYHSVPAE